MNQIKNRIKFISLIMLFLLCESCETYIYIYVCVKDNQTKMPISNAIICVVNEKGRIVDSLMTDINGCVKKSNLVGCIPRCPDYYLKVFARNYDTLYTEESVRNYSDKKSAIIFLNQCNLELDK